MALLHATQGQLTKQIQEISDLYIRLGKLTKLLGQRDTGDSRIHVEQHWEMHAKACSFCTHQCNVPTFPYVSETHAFTSKNAFSSLFAF